MPRGLQRRGFLPSCETVLVAGVAVLRVERRKMYAGGEGEKSADGGEKTVFRGERPGSRYTTGERYRYFKGLRVAG